MAVYRGYRKSLVELDYDEEYDLESNEQFKQMFKMFRKIRKNSKNQKFQGISNI